jgi:conjugation system TraG family ATPase
MEKRLEELLPVIGVEADCILSGQGDYTVCYEVSKPAIFSLSDEQHEAIHQSFVRAIKVLPVHSVFHMMDWFTESKWKADFSQSGESFLGHASARFFHERPYLEQVSYLFLTKRAGKKLVSSALSNILSASLVPAASLDEHTIREFLECCGQFVRILEDGRLIRLRRLSRDEIWSQQDRAGILERYCFLSDGKDRVVRDIVLDDGLKIGDQHCQLFTLADAEGLPGLCGPRINYDQYSTDRSKFGVGFSAVLGQLLDCNHIYNQYIFIGDRAETLKKLEARRLRMRAMSAYARENALAEEAVNDFLNEAVGDQALPVRAHFNILAWTDQAALKGDVKSKVSSALTQLGAAPKQETAGLAQIWWAGIPGNEGAFPMNDTFDSFLPQACCLLNWEGCYRDSPSAFGMRVVDRISGRPLHLDITDWPMSVGQIVNRNKLVLGSTGAGKSLWLCHLLRNYYEMGSHIVVIDIGHSYQGLCQLLGGIYFTYSETNPIAFNPFYLSPGDVMDIEKRESIKALLTALWKMEDDQFTKSEYVALSNALVGYLEHLAAHPDLFPCFNSFYEYLQNEFADKIKKEGVRDKDFDLGNFLFVLRGYYRGGEFDYLLNATENLDVLHARFIVFELDNIVDHPIFPIVTVIIMELFIGKMRKLPGIRKAIVIEEAWKQIAKGGMAGFMLYLEKTVRKFYGEIIVASQELEDLISSPILKETVINCSDCKVILDVRQFLNKFDELQAVLGLTDQAKVMALSLNRANDPRRKYREFMVDLKGSVNVYGFEPSREEYLAYTTEQKEKVRVLEYARRYGGLRNGIEQIIREENDARINGVS